MVQPGHPLDPAKAGPFYQAQQVVPARAQSGRISIPPMQSKAQRLLVKGNLVIQVGHVQGHVPNAGIWVNREAGRFEGLGLVHS